jgi:hypothetical protein
VAKLTLFASSLSIFFIGWSEKKKRGVRAGGFFIWPRIDRQLKETMIVSAANSYSSLDYTCCFIMNAANSKKQLRNANELHFFLVEHPS